MFQIKTANDVVQAGASMVLDHDANGNFWCRCRKLQRVLNKNPRKYDQIHSNNKYTFLNRCPLVFFKVPERVSIFHDLTVLELEYSKDTILKVIIQRYKYKYK